MLRPSDSAPVAAFRHIKPDELASPDTVECRGAQRVSLQLARSRLRREADKMRASICKSCTRPKKSIFGNQSGNISNQWCALVRQHIAAPWQNRFSCRSGPSSVNQFPGSCIHIDAHIHTMSTIPEFHAFLFAKIFAQGIIYCLYSRLRRSLYSSRK